MSKDWFVIMYVITTNKKPHQQGWGLYYVFEASQGCPHGQEHTQYSY